MTQFTFSVATAGKRRELSSAVPLPPDCQPSCDSAILGESKGVEPYFARLEVMQLTRSSLKTFKRELIGFQSQGEPPPGPQCMCMHIESPCVDRPLTPDLDRDIADHNACDAASLDLGSFSPRGQGFRVEHTHDPVVPRSRTRAREESQTVHRFLVIGIVLSRVRVS